MVIRGIYKDVNCVFKNNQDSMGDSDIHRAVHRDIVL